LLRGFALPVLIAATWWLCAAAAPAAQASVADGFYGVNAQDLLTGPSSAWGTQLSAMASGGLQQVRTDARWWTAEPSAPSGSTHYYDWSRFDATVQALASHGLRWYAILESAPDWAAAAHGDQSPARSHFGDFAAYASAFARRYGRGGSYWATHRSLTPQPITDYEIWNEQNSTTFWESQGDAPERFADLYMAARGAIKAVDPAARVVTGGLALGNPPAVADELGFLRRMVSRRPDLRGNVDGVGLHPYQPTLPDTYARIASFRQTVDQLLSPSVPIDITEVGWSTTAVSDAQRAGDLAALATQLPQSDCNIARFLPYSWTADESNGSDPEDWFGIWNRNGVPKTSGSAYVQAVQAMRSAAAPPPGTLHICTSGGPDASAGAPGPRLRLRVVMGRRHRRLTVRARCPRGCALSVTLKRHHPRGRASVVARKARFSSRMRRLRFKIPRGARRLELRVVAVGSGGGRTSRARAIRLKH
jgi:hypothetical protein